MHPQSTPPSSETNLISRSASRPVPLTPIAILVAVACCLLNGTASLASAEGLVGATQHQLRQAQDPAGDTFNNFGSSYDIRRIGGYVLDNKLWLEVSVESNTTALPNSGSQNELWPRFEIDVDQDPSTGIEATGDGLNVGTNGIGVDYVVDFLNFDSATGFVPVTETFSGQGSGIADVVTGTTLGPVEDNSTNYITVIIPLSAIGNDDGRVNFTVAMGDQSAFGDNAPNTGFGTSSLESEVLLRDNRFLVTMEWTDFQGNSGKALPFIQTNESVMMYFFGPTNWEMLIKVLDGCSIPGFPPFYWVYAGGPTDVQYRIEITDLLVGVTQVYENPLGNAAPAIRDTLAFPTCSGII